VPEQRIDLEPALLGQRGPALDDVEVAVEHVDLDPVEVPPCSAVHQPAPLAGVDDGPGVAERAQVPGVEVAPVVEPEVPVAVG
jgi:hypothetical protein